MAQMKEYGGLPKGALLQQNWMETKSLLTPVLRSLSSSPLPAHMVLPGTQMNWGELVVCSEGA